jgi:hypothetical protein
MEHRAQRVQQDTLQAVEVVVLIRHLETQVVQVVADLEVDQVGPLLLQVQQQQLILVVVGVVDQHSDLEW